MTPTPLPGSELVPERLQDSLPKQAGVGTLLLACALFALIVVNVERIAASLGLPLLMGALLQESILLAAALVLARWDGLTADDMGFRGPWTWVEGVYIPVQFFGHWILSGLFAVAIMLLGIPALPAGTGEAGPADFAWLTAPWPVAFLSVATLAAAAGFCEEVAFRGYLVPRLMQSGVSPAWAAVISGSLFALAHVPGYGLAASIPKALFFGIPMAYYLARRRDLWAVILVHALVDLFALSGLLLVLKLLPMLTIG